MASDILVIFEEYFFLKLHIHIPSSYLISRTSYFCAICFYAFYFCAVKQFIHLRTNNFSAQTKYFRSGLIFSDSVQIRENADTIQSTCWKIQIRESPHFGVFHAVREEELDAN